MIRRYAKKPFDGLDRILPLFLEGQRIARHPIPPFLELSDHRAAGERTAVVVDPASTMSQELGKVSCNAGLRSEPR